jgi:hypothetical protein
MLSSFAFGHLTGGAMLPPDSDAIGSEIAVSF